MFVFTACLCYPQGVPQISKSEQQYILHTFAGFVWLTEYKQLECNDRHIQYWSLRKPLTASGWHTVLALQCAG